MTAPNNPKPEKSGHDLRSYFMRGLFFIIPIAVTIWLLNFVVGLADGWLGGPIRLIAHLLLPSSWFAHENAAWMESVLGLLSLITLGVILLALGVVASFRIGKEGLRLVDHLFVHIPGVNAVYRSIRKMVDTFGDGNTTSFQRCVYMRFPGQYWSLGLVTKEMKEAGTGRKILAVLVPQAPNPIGGFIQYVPEEETVATDISTEEALKIVVSMGVISPEEFPKLPK
jgi:uncharacterized membrane protein